MMSVKFELMTSTMLVIPNNQQVTAYQQSRIHNIIEVPHEELLYIRSL